MKISVCLATYNGEKFIKEQLDSIRSQLSINDEIIISDDGSTDKTVNIIESLKDERIRIFYSNQRNLIYNFENAIKKASGDVIFLSDQDDIWFPNKVEKMMKLMEEYLLVFSNALIFKVDHKKPERLLYKPKPNLNNFFINLYKNKFIGATMAFRIELLDSVLPFPKDIPIHDMWLGFVAIFKGKTHYINEPLVYYRRHGNNASMAGEKSSFDFRKQFIIRWNIIKRLISRILETRHKKNKRIKKN